MCSTLVARTFICPYDGLPVDCVVEEEAAGRLLRLWSCSGRERRVAPPCDQVCVDMINMGMSLDSDGDG
jgi:hypothetical protein